jgi:hypothetical protein
MIPDSELSSWRKYPFHLLHRPQLTEPHPPFAEWRNPRPGVAVNLVGADILKVHVSRFSPCVYDYLIARW